MLLCVRNPGKEGLLLLSVPKPICPILDILILDARTREKVGYI